MRKGWECPVCGAGVSPDETRCEHDAAMPAATHITTTTTAPPPTAPPPRDWRPWKPGDPYASPLRRFSSGSVSSPPVNPNDPAMWIGN